MFILSHKPRDINEFFKIYLRKPILRHEFAKKRKPAGFRKNYSRILSAFLNWNANKTAVNVTAIKSAIGSAR